MPQFTLEADRMIKGDSESALAAVLRSVGAQLLYGVQPNGSGSKMEVFYPHTVDLTSLQNALSQSLSEFKLTFE